LFELPPALDPGNHAFRHSMKIVLRVVASGHISVHFDDQPATCAGGNGGEVIVGSEGEVSRLIHG
jgi:hypothetical protein